MVSNWGEHQSQMLKVVWHTLWRPSRRKIAAIGPVDPLHEPFKQLSFKPTTDIYISEYVLASSAKF